MVRRRRAVVHYGRLELTRVRASATSSRDRDGNVKMVHNMLLSQEDEKSPTTLTATKAGEEGRVGRTLGER